MLRAISNERRSSWLTRKPLLGLAGVSSPGRSGLAGLTERPRARWIVSETRARNERRDERDAGASASGGFIIASSWGEGGATDWVDMAIAVLVHAQADGRSTHRASEQHLQPVRVVT